MNRRLYFDNAATSFPKPECVYEAMNHYARHIGASAGRGAYQEAMESGQIIAETRSKIAEFIGANDPDNIIMTFNCTDGLVQAIKGIGFKPGDHVISSMMDHNSVLRPLETLKQTSAIDVTYVAASQEGLIDPDDIRKAIRPQTRLIALVHGSNVCGSVQDIASVGDIAAEHEIPFLVDAAQTVGHLPIDVGAFQVDMLAFPGHKGLLGPLGTGILYIRPGFEKRLQTLKEGGTGSKSENPTQPEFMPDRFEAGSHNALGIAGLHAALLFLQDKGIQNLRDHEEMLCRIFLENTSDVPGLKVYGPPNVYDRVGVFSVTVDGLEPAELAAILESHFGLLTRPGLHCAPYAHQTIGSFDLGGTCRLSTGLFLTKEDVLFAAEALRVITLSHVKSYGHH